MSGVVPPWVGYRVVETQAAEQSWDDSVIASHRCEDIKSRCLQCSTAHHCKHRDLMSSQRCDAITESSQLCSAA
ncbi:hypothetical protein PLESTB_000110500 [Pleodorina starrii]|uniref:Uncharacterized protein n=1 Tax=Pleodorina starrii TaxID=330485 RepID=A0A9W6EXL2_9CHLO|nr:hypothetical protein PLESTB_000110500 [Pleodorina starrii]GLC71874.1 hypothetical protein PLESTF_001176300 [Pleodorina starrii]